MSPGACSRGHVGQTYEAIARDRGRMRVHCKACQRENWQRRYDAKAEERAELERGRRAELRSNATPLELAWVAGLFEGEGTVTIATNGRDNEHTKLCVCVASTDPETLEPFARLWPVQALGERMPASKTGNARRCYEWRLYCLRATVFLEEVLPYVRTNRVRTKMTLALAAQNSRRRGSRKDPAYNARQQAFRAQMKVLNRRGAGAP